MGLNRTPPYRGESVRFDCPGCGWRAVRERFESGSGAVQVDFPPTAVEPHGQCGAVRVRLADFPHFIFLERF